MAFPQDERTGRLRDSVKQPAGFTTDAHYSKSPNRGDEGQADSHNVRQPPFEMNVCCLRREESTPENFLESIHKTGPGMKDCQAQKAADGETKDELPTGIWVDLKRLLPFAGHDPTSPIQQTKGYCYMNKA
jgi:hypothetical protein